VPGTKVVLKMKKLEETLENFLDYLSIERGLAENTIISYRYDLIKYIVFLKKERLVLLIKLIKF